MLEAGGSRNGIQRYEKEGFRIPCTRAVALVSAGHRQAGMTVLRRFSTFYEFVRVKSSLNLGYNPDYLPAKLAAKKHKKHKNRFQFFARFAPLCGKCSGIDL